MIFYFRQVFFIFATALISCANQGPPPGGPPDRTPPRVVWTAPFADSVGVATEGTIRIRFSEAMDRTSVERVIFISPRPDAEVRYKWRGPEVEVRLEGGLRPDRTYLVTVGREGADEWRNRMVASYSFAFSTGAVLDRGEVFGRIRPLQGVQGETFVWAYDLQGDEVPDPGHDRPAYVTQPDASGEYRLPRLGPGRYRIFAFLDQDRDRAYGGSEPLGVPPADVKLAGEGGRVRLGDLRMAVRDTVPPRLVSARTPDGAHLSLRFDGEVRVVGAISVGGLEVRGVYQDPEDSSRVFVLTEAQAEGTAYGVDLEGVVDRAGNRFEAKEEIQVRGDGTADRRGPEQVAIAPEPGALYVAPDAPLRVDFSEAMQPRIDLGDFWVASDSTRAVEGTFSWPAVNRLIFVPSGGWISGETYRLFGRPGRLSDTSGNPLKGAIEAQFSVLVLEDLGELTGEVEPSDAPAMVEALQAGSPERIYTAGVAGGDSVFSLSVVPGPYRISGFLDVDGDQQWSPGQAMPFSPADPLFHTVDTLEVRARWENRTRERFRAVFFQVLDPQVDAAPIPDP